MVRGISVLRWKSKLLQITLVTCNGKTLQYASIRVYVLAGVAARASRVGITKENPYPPSVTGG